jgi:hypothetical protein
MAAGDALMACFDQCLFGVYTMMPGLSLGSSLVFLKVSLGSLSDLVCFAFLSVLTFLELVVGDNVRGRDLLHMVDDLVEAVEGLVFEGNEGIEVLHADLVDATGEHEQGIARLANSGGTKAEDGVDHISSGRPRGS